MRWEGWSETPEAAPAPRSRSRTRLLVGIGGAALALAGLTIWAITNTVPEPIDVSRTQRPLTAAEASEYLGDAACSACHANISAEHRRTGHALTLRPVSTQRDGAIFAQRVSVHDGMRHVRYRPKVDGTKCLLEAAEKDKISTAAADYVLGSGKNGISFLSESAPRTYRLLSLSYFIPQKKWGYTPGASAPPGQPLGGDLPPDMLELCVSCHATIVRQDENGPNLASTVAGVGCERCHGPGRRHVIAINRNGHDPAMERLSRAKPARVVQLCGACHRDLENASPEATETKQNLPRFQGVGIQLSACYQKSGKLTCTTCHNPHQDVSTNLAGYNSICLSCHQAAAQQKPCPVQPSSGCTRCHMPRQRVGGVAFASFSNHWIKVWKAD